MRSSELETRLRRLRRHVKASGSEKTVAFTVLPDPKSPGTQQTIEAQVASVREVLAKANLEGEERLSGGREEARP